MKSQLFLKIYLIIIFFQKITLTTSEFIKLKIAFTVLKF